jgi:DNA-binding NarL/FixJ family response regulator
MSRTDHASDSKAARPRAGHQVLSDEQWHRLATALKLSSRQLQIVKCMFDDQIETGIGRELSISEHTVHTHIERLYRKLEVSSRSELLVRIFAEFLAGRSSGVDIARGGREGGSGHV